MIQYLEPCKTAFQALVALGSLWKVEPLLFGPIMSHRCAGRSRPSISNKSGPKHSGFQYSPFLSRPTAIPILSTKIAVEQVERAFILIVTNVVAVRPKGPVNSLGPEVDSGILTSEKVNVPFAKCRP